MSYQSTHPIGTVLELRRKGHRLTATLHRRFPNGEEWRITGPHGYLFSEGWPFVQEHQAHPITDFAAALNPPAGALALDVRFTLAPETPPEAQEEQLSLFTDDKDDDL